MKGIIVIWISPQGYGFYIIDFKVGGMSDFGVNKTPILN